MSIWSRRNFLRGLGAGVASGALAGTVPLLDREVAEASGAYPCRFVVYYTPNGTVLDEWKPSGGERDFTLGRILTPLAPFRDCMVVIEGLTNESSLHGLGNGHSRGGVGVLTATELTKDDGVPGSHVAAGGLSVDQQIANAIATGTPFSSVQLGTGTRSTTVSYSGREAPLPPEQNPRSAADRLFSAIDTSGPAPVTHDRERRILDAVSGQLGSIRDAVGRDGRDKMEAHLSAIESIEARFDELERRAGTCGEPSLDASGLGYSGSYLTDGRLHEQVGAAALACDLTRVLTIQYGTYGGISGSGVPEVGISSKDQYHQMGHDNDKDDDAHETMTRIWEIYARNFHDFLASLDAVPEGDGTLLDNTLVLWVTSMNDGHHRWDDMPYLLAGGRNMGLQGGRYLRYSGVNHNDLLVSCCNLMGLSEVDRFGNPDYGTGPLARL